MENIEKNVKKMLDRAAKKLRVVNNKLLKEEFVTHITNYMEDMKKENKVTDYSLNLKKPDKTHNLYGCLRVETIENNEEYVTWFDFSHNYKDVILPVIE